MTTNGIPNSNQMTTNGIPSIDKSSIDKINIDEDSKEKTVAEITKHYESNISLLVPTTATILLDLIDSYDKDLIKHAIDIACKRNIRNMAYIEGILKDWNKKGYKVLADIQNENKYKKENKNNEQTTDDRLEMLKKMQEERRANERAVFSGTN